MWRFGGELQDLDMGLLASYLYHANAGPPSGEQALGRILAPGKTCRMHRAMRVRSISSYS